METLPFEFGAHESAVKSLALHGDVFFIPDDSDGDDGKDPAAAPSACPVPDNQLGDETLYPNGDPGMLDKPSADVPESKSPCGECELCTEKETEPKDMDLDSAEIPIVSRKSQRGVDTSGEGGGEDEVEDQDYDADKPQDSEVVEADKPQKPKSKAKSSAKPKPRSKASAKAKAKAKAKTSAAEKKRTKKEEKEAKDAENKRRAKRQCVVRPTADQSEKEEEQKEDDAVVDNNELKDEDMSKADDAKQPGKVKGKNVEKKEKVEKQKVVKKGDGKGKAEKKDGKNKDEKDDAKDEVLTFARRYMPESETKATKFRAIRDVFMESLSSRLNSQSRFQDKHAWTNSVSIQKGNRVPNTFQRCPNIFVRPPLPLEKKT